MNAFKDIMKNIEEDLKGKDPSETNSGDETPVDDKGMPAPHKKTAGTIISKPGTENILFNASSFQLMECMSEVRGKDKHRYCIVEKDKHAEYGNQHVNSVGNRTHIITREVFMLLLSVLKNASKQIERLTQQVKDKDDKIEMFTITFGALKKNGIID